MTDWLWAEASKYGSDISKQCVINSVDKGIIPYELRHGCDPLFDVLLSFGFVEYMTSARCSGTSLCRELLRASYLGSSQDTRVRHSAYGI